MEAPESSDGPRDDASCDELYTEAKRRDITGRSSMTKDQLKQALRA